MSPEILPHDEDNTLSHPISDEFVETNCTVTNVKVFGRAWNWIFGLAAYILRLKKGTILGNL